MSHLLRTIDGGLAVSPAVGKPADREHAQPGAVVALPVDVVADLARSIRGLESLLGVLVESMPPKHEAALLGCSTKTIHRRREQRRMQRLLRP